MAEEAKVEEKPNSNGVAPWQVSALVDKQVYEYMPALFNALRSIHEELVEIKEALKEK
jgi:hypothetical protein